MSSDTFPHPQSASSWHKKWFTSLQLQVHSTKKRYLSRGCAAGVRERAGAGGWERSIDSTIIAAVNRVPCRDYGKSSGVFPHSRGACSRHVSKSTCTRNVLLILDLLRARQNFVNAVLARNLLECLTSRDLGLIDFLNHFVLRVGTDFTSNLAPFVSSFDNFYEKLDTSNQTGHFWSRIRHSSEQTEHFPNQNERLPHWIKSKSF